MSVSPDTLRGRRVVLAILAVVSVAGLALLLGYPALKRMNERREITELLADMKSLQNTMAMAKLDAQEGFGFPADVGAKSTRDYFSRFVKDGYLTEAELAGLLSRHHVAIANISASDPADTALFVMRDSGRAGFAVFYKGGGGGIYKRERDWETAAHLPNREPQILP